MLVNLNYREVAMVCDAMGCERVPGETFAETDIGGWVRSAVARHALDAKWDVSAARVYAALDKLNADASAALLDRIRDFWDAEDHSVRRRLVAVGLLNETAPPCRRDGGCILQAAA